MILIDSGKTARGFNWWNIQSKKCTTLFYILTCQSRLLRRRTKEPCPSLCGIRLLLFPQTWIPVFITLLSTWYVMMFWDFTSRHWQVSFTSVHLLIMEWYWRRSCRAGHVIKIVKLLKPCQRRLGLEMFFTWDKAGQEVHALGTWNADFYFIIRISAKLKGTRTLKEKAPAPLAPVFTCQSTVPDPDYKEQRGAGRRRKEEVNCLTHTLFGLANKIC